MQHASARQINSIPGWFGPIDWALFRFGLDESARQVGTGDLAEIGTYLGRSAVVIGESLGPTETFTVIDLFGAPADDADNESENNAQYVGLTKDAFEANYLRVHEQLPVVVQGPSSQITKFAAPGVHRFVHVDGSHLYEQVGADISATRKLLAQQGMGVFDDFRSAHAPGVSAAVWEAVSDGLHPIVITEQKLYATWGDATPWLAAVEKWLPTTGFHYEEQTVHGRQLFRAWTVPFSLRFVIGATNLRWRLNATTRKAIGRLTP